MKQENEHRINEAIRSPKVRMININGDNVGVVSLSEAMQAASVAGTDLVEIVPNAKPPVVRVMDYGKYKFEESKKKAENKKKQKKTQLKEIKFRPTTDIGDYNVKVRKLREFLEEGDKTKVTIRFRGRELAHRDLGRDLLKRVETDLEDISTVEQYPKLEGRQMMMMLGPKKSNK
ncbi:MAG: translation initiation factor IF-3 [bacterium]